MGRIPQATSKQTLSGKAPNIKVAPGSFAITGKAITQAGKAISATAARFKDLQNLEEYTAASTTSKIRLEEIAQRAQQDEDIYTIEERYSQEIQKTKSEVLKTISDRESQIRFGAEFDIMAKTKSFNVRSIARGKQIDKSKATLLEDLDQSENDFYGASSPLERKQLSDGVKFRLDEYARLGVVSAESAAEQKKAWDDNVRIGQVSFDANIDPDFAKKNVEDGVYKLNPKEKQEALETINKLSDKKKKEADAIKKAAQDKNMSDAVKTYLTEGLSTDQVNDLLISGQIDLKQHKSLEDMVTRALPIDAKTEHDEYNNIKEMIYNGEDQALIQDRITNSIGKSLGKENAEELLDETIKKEEDFNKDAKKNALLKIKSFGNKEILKDQPFEIAPATLTGKVQELEFLFNRRVAKENAKGERLYEIADEVIDGYLRSVDPQYQPVKGKSNERVKVLNDGQTAINIKTGEQIQLIGGRWIPIN